MAINKRVLIVEDDIDSLELTADVLLYEIQNEPRAVIKKIDDPAKELRQKGFDVAQTYSEAEQYIQANDYDYILLDHKMPRAKGEPVESIGYTLIPVIRKKNPRTIIIGTSSVPDCLLAGLDLPDRHINKITMELETILREILDT
ncbi:hypothetical protein KY340_01405 [Candidatus Woesearchaeota archaeon]|nr:hypothetical protein [Candidatus Woesearchaeota archaeon]